MSSNIQEKVTANARLRQLCSTVCVVLATAPETFYQPTGDIFRISLFMNKLPINSAANFSDILFTFENTTLVRQKDDGLLLFYKELFENICMRKKRRDIRKSRRLRITVHAIRKLTAFKPIMFNVLLCLISLHEYTFGKDSNQLFALDKLLTQ